MAAQVVISLADLETAVPLDRALEAAGVRTEVFTSADEGQRALSKHQPLLLVLTGGIHEGNTHALASRAREMEIAVLALTEPTDSEGTTKAVATGATAVLTKPQPTDDLVGTVARILERRGLQRRTGIAGESGPIQEVLVKIEQMAPVSSTVLIEGESGTGKELVAKAIHDLSPRGGGPFIAINCAALPETLLESELFGHEKGAFTGAAERRLGRFELADKGTIFLDEIGEIPPSVQVKLLRVLETRSFFRLGGATPIKVDVRVVAATNVSLKERVAMGEFREDLFYRINVLSIYLPPLRDRRSDIPLLIRRFVREFAAAHDRPFPGIAAEAMERLVAAPWPGNIRQLRNLVESMVVLAPDTPIRASDIPVDVTESYGSLLPVRIGHTADRGGLVGGPEFEFILRSLLELRVQVEELRRRLEDGEGDRHSAEVLPDGDEPTVTIPVTPVGAVGVEEEPEQLVVVWREGQTMVDMERAVIEAVLTRENGNRRRAAQLLGIGERTLYRKLKEYAII